MEKTSFLEKYNIKPIDFEKTGFKWEFLTKIYNNYAGEKDKFEPAINEIAEKLKKVEKVHSIKTRIKDPEHLIEKIIRKKRNDSNFNITLDNYKDVITDLIGIRALHLFKEDWGIIHNYIKDTGGLIEKPIANIRKGDNSKLSEKFENAGCKIIEHDFGYRSIHYIIKLHSKNQSYIAEIQTRTLFEEAWSEIDHLLRYPHNKIDDNLKPYLLILNRLSGSADEMCSHIKLLIPILEEKSKKIKELENKIESLEIRRKLKDEIMSDIYSLKTKIVSEPFFPCATHLPAEGKIQWWPESPMNIYILNNILDTPIGSKPSILANAEENEKT